MVRPGFIHDKLDIKLLILYILARAAEPVDFSTITDLTVGDGVMDYFDYAECLAELVSTDHLKLDNDRYAVTEKGERNGRTCESSLPAFLRKKCDERLEKLNVTLRRESQVQAQVLPRDDGTHTVRLHLDDEADTLLALDLLAVSSQQAEQIAQRFRNHPEAIYNGILKLLTEKSFEKEKEAHPQEEKQ